MKVMLTLLTAGVVAFGTSCASIKVKSEYRKQVDFTEYKTYDWIEQPEKPFAYLTSMVNRKRIVKAIRENVDNKLLLRGYRRVESNPDFQIVYHANVKGKIQTAPLGYDSRSEMYIQQNITVRDYQEGSLVLDFVEAKSNSLIWRGIAVGAVQNEQKVQEQIRQAISKLLQGFPPKK